MILILFHCDETFVQEGSEKSWCRMISRHHILFDFEPSRCMTVCFGGSQSLIKSYLILAPPSMVWPIIGAPAASIV